jgi:hypothetical protein
MKAPVLFGFLLASVLLSSPVRAATNLVDVVLAEGSFQWGKDRVAKRLPEALESAALVMRATVLDTNAVVRASPNQREVSAGQGWTAAVVGPVRMLKGEYKDKVLLVSNGAYRIDGLHWGNPISTMKGRDCILVLQRDNELSRYCQTNIYAIAPFLEVK